jgi:hypothetical protein
MAGMALTGMKNRYVLVTLNQGWTYLLTGELERSTHAAGHQWLMPIIQATQEAEIRRIARRTEAEGQPGQIERPYLKDNQHKKRAGGVAQMTECLSSKHWPPSSNSSNTLPQLPPKKRNTHAWTLPLIGLILG